MDESNKTNKATMVFNDKIVKLRVFKTKWTYKNIKEKTLVRNILERR